VAGPPGAAARPPPADVLRISPEILTETATGPVENEEWLMFLPVWGKNINH
jgi:hypothetical protein